MSLRISADLLLPLDYMTKTAAILAQRRKGKTYTASVIAEELVDAGQPFVVLDPTGAWWGLRASADAKGPGLPVTILGGEHGDVPLERKDGRGVADLVVDEPGWYVIDFGFAESNAAEVEFAADFASRLYRRKGQPNSDFPLHLFVDEADRFVPQNTGGRGNTRGEGNVTVMLGAFEAIVRRGGLRGLGTTLISQRSAVVNKNVLEQADLFIILRTVGPNDRKRIKEIVEAEATKEQMTELESSVASLDLGEAWVWEPGEALFQRVRVRERRTFNSSATPKPGEKRVEPRQLATVDLEAIKERWSEQIEKAKADDPVELRRQITALKRELDRARAAVPEPVVERVEVPVLDADLVARLEAALEPASSLLNRLGEVQASLVTAARDGARAAARPVARPEPRKRTVPAPRPAPAQVDVDGLSAYATVLLTALAKRHPVPLTIRQWSVAADRSTTSSGWDPAVRELRQAGLVVQRDGDWSVSEEGLAVAGVDPGTPPPSGRELVDWWCERITGPNAGAAKTALRLLAEHEPMSVDELADLAGWSRTSSGPGAAVSILVKLDLAERRGGVVHLDEELYY